jgi:hypothetical protein
MNGEEFSSELPIIGRLNNSDLSIIDLSQDPDEMDDHIYGELAHNK